MKPLILIFIFAVAPPRTFMAGPRHDGTDATEILNGTMDKDTDMFEL